MNKAIEKEQQSPDEVGAVSRLGAFVRRLRAARTIASTGIGLVAVWVVLAFASPFFLTLNNVLNILLQASVLAILAAGVTYALIAGEIDLSIGSVVAFVGAAAAVLMVRFAVPWPIAMLVALAIGAATGAVSGFFRTRFGIPSFVTTLAMMGIARGLALVITDGQSVYGLPRAFNIIGQGRIGFVPIPVVIAGIVLIGLQLTLTKTRFGLNVYAVGGNAEAARLSGVDISRIRMSVLVISGIAAALGGIVLAARLGSGSGTVGDALLLDAIAAVVIGGTSLMGGIGTITGTVMGVLLIASIRNGLVLLGVSAFWQIVAIGVLILLAVFLDHLAKVPSARQT